MGFLSLLNKSCRVQHQVEGTEEDEYGNYLLTMTVLYNSVPCALQSFESGWRDERVPGTVEKETKMLFTPIISIDEDNFIYIDSKYYKVIRTEPPTGRSHHLEIQIQRFEG